MQSGAASPGSPVLSGVAGRSGFLLQEVRLDWFSPECAGGTDTLDGLCQESSRPKDSSQGRKLLSPLGDSHCRVKANFPAGYFSGLALLTGLTGHMSYNTVCSLVTSA